MPRTAVYWLIGVQHTQAGTHWITVVPDFLEGCSEGAGSEARLQGQGRTHVFAGLHAVSATGLRSAAASSSRTKGSTCSPK
ncbi:hypothetical protein ALP68_102136 [Pseudomonas ficuserectae]|nr:hypothetical protein ALO69_102438 [Pseudomonas ficuserectae]RMS28542.1 hypothetical protein ALP68_102136 [Pseudomonas ficuserectae]RMS43569.1 hypothetical protein ALP67_102019 [Pseudomonas ficuserectae]